MLLGLAIAFAQLAARLLPAKDAQRGVLPAWLLPSPSIQTLEGPVKQRQGSKEQGQGSRKQGKGSKRQGQGQKNKAGSEKQGQGSKSNVSPCKGGPGAVKAGVEPFTRRTLPKERAAEELGKDAMASPRMGQDGIQ